jgi:hypothetical protein
MIQKQMGKWEWLFGRIHLVVQKDNQVPQAGPQVMPKSRGRDHIPSLYIVKGKIVTQGLVLARQTLYHLNHTPSPF